MSGGPAILAATTGLVGLAWLTIGTGVAGVILLFRARSLSGEAQARAALWAAATAVATCALLAPGGLSVPAVTFAVVVMWGVLPAMVGRVGTGRPGILVLVTLAAVALALGMVRKAGLAAWAWESFGLDYNWLHGPAGFLLALCAAWVLGVRRVWLGLIAIVLAAGAGWLGEVLQAQYAARRWSEVRDWVYHVCGCVLALIPYLLAMGSRLCELPPMADNIPSSRARPR